MNKKYNFCIVDDDDIYQFTIKKTIKHFDLAENIVSFNDGEEALNFILENLNEDKELPDVILLDINMPIMDGFQFMEEYTKIKPKLGKNITIYMVSSSIDDADIEKTKRISEISEYIVKPIQETQLKSIIEKLHNVENME
ncbi:response regulator [Maribacter polysiphoniae]|uniref:Response regulator n=1 Tax=Maribacter polysiphoniae TaxID=429344 RepID=A0A316E981_9FLAO|nr:response regulator [Maribacter polysiphoniae]MBD1262401.1 response regulator [Maribacter polysiphoniae]PWK26102.1 response regulator receiver domain-containing protein [Maribacter polysiphoniae]